MDRASQLMQMTVSLQTELGRHNWLEQTEIERQRQRQNQNRIDSVTMVITD